MRELTPQSSLESLKKEAKGWLKSLRAGDLAARERLLAILPDSPAEPGLRHVQLALAREHGLPGWEALRQALEDIALALRSHAELADLLLQSAKPWDSDKAAAARIWARVAPRMPGLSRHSLHAAAMFGDLDEAKRHLARDPDAVKQKGGPLDWEPLQYLAYGRLPGAEVHSVEIARLLIENGADVNVNFDDGWGNPFTLLNGVIGQGEQSRTEHPRAMDLASLFIDAGKDAFDTQVNYDTALGPDETRWLELLWSRSDPAKWHGKIYVRERASTLDYLLGLAVDRRDMRRAEWLLDHGADPNGTHGYSLQPIIMHAQLYGGREMLVLLERHGGQPRPLKGEEAFMAACLSGDLDEIRRIATRTPPLALHPHPLIEAAQRDLDEVVALLLELGMPPDRGQEDGKRALHWAAQSGSVKVARLLIAAGADIDARGSRYRGTPLGFALHFGQQAMIDLLTPLTHDIGGLANAGKLERLGALLDEGWSVAIATDPEASYALFGLPDDEDLAAEAAELLLALGANPRATRKDGETPAIAARKRGLDDAAEVIEAAGG